MTDPRSFTSKVLALLEGVGWLFGYWAAQALVMLALFAGLVTAAYGFQWPSLFGLLDYLVELQLENSFLVIGVVTLGSLFLIIPAIRVRLGPKAREQLGLTPLRRDHAVFAIAMIVPVATVGNAVYQVADGWWVSFLNGLGVGDVLGESTLATLHRTFHGVPYPVLVVAVALGPAIGEEFVFRGVVGRRLIASWGVPLGIAFTSILFGLAHFSPPHALATIPIAVVAHLLYLHCGSIWVPILLHFGNNLLAVSAVRFSLIPDINVTLEGVLAAFVYLGLLLVAWQVNERQLGQRVRLPAQ